MTAQIVSIERTAGRGRQPRAVEETRELHLELQARRAEAVELVDGLTPMVSALIAGCRELGPLHYQTAIAIRDRLERYRRQQEPEPEGRAA